MIRLTGNTLTVCRKVYQQWKGNITMSSADRTGNSTNYVGGRCTAARVSPQIVQKGGQVKLECSTLESLMPIS